MMLQNNPEPKFFRTLFDDLGQFFSDLFSGDFWKKIKTDYREIRTFFIDEHRQKHLQDMGRFKRFFVLFGWLFKILFFHLSSFRRILFIIAILLLLSFQTTGNSSSGKLLIGIILLLFIILLELKDKLLARDELEAGRSIQQALIPATSPIIPGWDIWLFTRPANEVGGDLVDYLKINSNRYGFAIGDVAGKGLPAALLMAKLQSTLRVLAPDISSLTALAKKINAIFYRDSLPNRFASMIYLQLSSESDRVQLVNAGHLPPLYIKNGQLHEFDKGSPALGIMPDMDFHEDKITIGKDDLLIVYSDGLTEARNEKGDFFGEGGLKSLLVKLNPRHAREAGEQIVAAIDSFVGDAPSTDDLSIIIIRRNN